MKRKHKRVIYRLALSAALTVVCLLLPEGESWAWGLLPLLPYLVIGYDVLWSALRNILHGQIFDENFLMAIATVGALAMGEYYEAVGVMLFYQVGELFQSLAVGKSRRSIAALMDIRPDRVVVIRDGEETEVSPDEISVGEMIVVRVGEKIALDGEIIEGVTAVNTAALTGESMPVDKGVGDKVISGSVNLGGVIKVRVESVFAESTVSKILDLVENSAAKKARAENFITRFARYYTPCVVAGALLLAILPPVAFGGEWSDWIRRALIFLMVSCPCALVISVPMSFFGGIGGASRAGILIKGANYMEMLSGVDTVVFDKTGTLSLGSFEVCGVYPETGDESELIALAAMAESYSNHPLAGAIVNAYGAEIDKSRVGEVSEYAGMGLCAAVDGEKVYVGNAVLMVRAGATAKEPCGIGTAVHICREGEYLGYILVRDAVKPDAKEAIDSLKRKKIKKTVMLTGDSAKVAESVGKWLGLSEVRSELLPADKVAALEELIAAGGRVAFVGDGINDAPVLSRADVGIAMGAMGSDAAIEAADIVLMDDKPSKVAQAIDISKRTMRIVRQNIIFALSVKGIILILGALGLANVWIAVFGDVGVMILAILNAMRALKV